MKVLTRFQSPYDKYLFEGIINPEDYYSFVGTSLNGQIENLSGLDNDIVSLYVLNTLDHNIKVEPENPDNILTKFFSSMKTSGEKSEKTESPVRKNLLLISVQHPKVLKEVIEYFSSLEKVHRPNEPVVVYTISSFVLFSQLNDKVKNIIESYGKHTYIDLALATTAIELFKRRKLFDIYGSDIKELKGIGYDLINHNDKKIEMFRQGPSPEYGPKVLYIPKVKIDETMCKNIFDFLNPENTSDESYVKRLVPLIPKFNYRYYDKLETFYKASSNETEGPEILYNVLIIRNPELSFKMLLYISIFKWNLIFFENIKPEVLESKLSECYEQLTSIYNDKSEDSKSYAPGNEVSKTSGSGTKGSKASVLKISKSELKKLNPDYSLLRTEKEIKYFDNAMKTIFPEQITTPHIMIDNYNDIKTYLKKLENSLKVDEIEMRVMEL